MTSAISDVYVATCDQEIADVVRRNNGKVIMTGKHHTNGTSRVAEAIAGIECSHAMLLQGDEPLLLPRHLKSVSDAIKKEPRGDAWNATGPIENPDELDRHSFVKCVTTTAGKILYCFRRTPCYSRFEVQREFTRKILGVIAYRKEFLLRLTSLPSSRIECAEYIEQMRIIENGFSLMSVEVTPSLPSVNEPGETDIILNYLRENPEQHALLNRVISM